MKSLTIHNLDDKLYYLISADAKKNRRSMNQEIIDKLHQYYDQNAPSNSNSFSKFLGVWNNFDKTEFNKNTSELQEADESDWQ